MLTREKIRGAFLGIAVGDALGMPVESFSRQKIREEYGRVTRYLVPDGHKWFNGHQSGEYTDDTQLSLAVAEGLMATATKGCSLDVFMEGQVASHVDAFREHTNGWGRSTRKSIRKLTNNVSWEESGQGGKEYDGCGNGVPMKIAPLALWFYMQYYDEMTTGRMASIPYIQSLSKMTHQTSIATSAALAQAFAVNYCCGIERPDEFSCDDFISQVIFGAELGKVVFPDTLDDDLVSQFEKLQDFCGVSEFEERIDEEFGAGSCYCFHSLPFTYVHFLRDRTINGLYDIVSAGGDTDTNGAMWGALYGVMHGEKGFPEELIDGLRNLECVLDVADRFSEKLLDNDENPENDPETIENQGFE